MLVTLLVLYYVRPVLRCRTRRRRATSILLVVASLVTFGGGPPAAIGEDRFDRGLSMVAGTTDPSPNDIDIGSGQPIRLFDEHQRLREGTTIPPTIGRVVKLGRRWAFVPADDNMPVRRELTERDHSISDSLGSGFSQPSLPNERASLVGGVRPRGEIDSRHPSPWNGSNLVRLADGDRLHEVGENGKFVVLCENQMLQRIVEAMRANETDNRWEISGELLEFFDQNRLLIRTIQRASAN